MPEFDEPGSTDDGAAAESTADTTADTQAETTAQ